MTSCASVPARRSGSAAWRPVSVSGLAAPRQSARGSARCRPRPVILVRLRVVLRLGLVRFRFRRSSSLGRAPRSRSPAAHRSSSGIAAGPRVASSSSAACGAPQSLAGARASTAIVAVRRRPALTGMPSPSGRRHGAVVGVVTRCCRSSPVGIRMPQRRPSTVRRRSPSRRTGPRSVATAPAVAASPRTATQPDQHQHGHDGEQPPPAPREPLARRRCSTACAWRRAPRGASCPGTSQTGQLGAPDSAARW